MTDFLSTWWLDDQSLSGWQLKYLESIGLRESVKSNLLFAMARPTIVVHQQDSEGRKAGPEMFQRRDFWHGRIHIDMHERNLICGDMR